jgi:cytochrome c peroxidase
MRTMVLWLVTFGAMGVVACDGAEGTDQATSSVVAVQANAGMSGGLDQHSVVALGKKLFFDQRLSANGNQACAACHGPEVGWTGPDVPINEHGSVYEGSVAGRFGNRKPPSSGYAAVAPVFSYDSASLTFTGGNFWDGRATGWKLGNPAADQAQGPFLNPVEQALPDAAAVLHLVCTGDYGPLFRKVWGRDACRQTDKGYDDVALSVSAYEGSREVDRFASKFDAYLAGRAHLTPVQQAGYQLFTGKARCTKCHIATGRAAGEGPLFTDFSYDNLGVPRNPENPFYRMDKVLVDGSPINPQGAAFVDEGLGGFLGKLAADDSWRSSPHVPEAMKNLTSAELTSLAAQNLGKQKVPTLRNVDKRPGPRFPKAYTHNGYFKSLAGLVHFYNTRDKLRRCPGDFTEREALARRCWPAPEEPRNVNTTEVGDLGLSAEEEGAVVAFLQTLTDEEHF